MPEPPPDTLTRLARALGDKYQVRRLVGTGGFAEVYEVWDHALERRLAVKVLRPDVAWTAGTIERFKQETRAVAKLEHPNILAIHFVGEGEGIVYYAMPFVEGKSLGDLLRQSGALPPERALAIAEPVLQALQHAHEAGLLHRDIKPDNIMLDTARGRPLLVDFGIARRLDADGALTQTGLVVGTPHYMSPEQALGDRTLGTRSDLYSMGAVLFQMVTGTPPFDGESSQEIVGKHIAEPPPAARTVNPRVPGWLSDVIARCLEKKPAARFPSAAHVLEALAAGKGRAGEAFRAISAQQAISGISPTAPTALVESGARPSGRSGDPTAPRPTPSRGRRLRLALLVALPAVIALGAAAVWLTRPRLAFHNRFAVPVAVTADGEERVVEPGGRFTLRLRGERALDVRWAVIRPQATDGTPLGVAIADTVRVTPRRGRVRVAASARPGGRAYFAPLITNTTGEPLRVIVNAGLQGALDCDCRVPPGATRMAIGYYPLFANSTVRAENAAGRGAMFENLGAQVEPESGVVRLEFRVADLR